MLTDKIIKDLKEENLFLKNGLLLYCINNKEYNIGFLTEKGRIHLYNPTAQFTFSHLSLNEIEKLIDGYWCIIKKYSSILD